MRVVRTARLAAILMASSSLFSLSCSFVKNGNLGVESSSKRDESSSSQGNQHFRSSNGNEVSLTIRDTGAGRFFIEAQNVSERSIYCPYLPARDGGIVADYFSYMVEKKNDLTGGFETLETGNDFAPGLNPIVQGEIVGFYFEANRNGTYRIRFSCLVDEDLAKIGKERHPLEISPDEGKLIEEASYTVISPEILADVEPTRSER